MQTQELIKLVDELNFAIQKAELLKEELKEARSLLAFGLEARQIAAVNRALFYAFVTDPVTKQEILNKAKSANDLEVLKLFDDKFPKNSDSK